MHHEMEKFLAVVEHGSFTVAARLTHVSQPALTSAVKSLEARYGTALLTRSTRPLQLTDAGRAVYHSANRIRLELSNLSSKLADMQSERGTKLTIGAIDSIAMQLLRQDIVIERFAVHVDNSSRLLEDVRLNRIEVAFITEPLVQPKDGLTLRRLMDERFLLVSHPSTADTCERTLRTQRSINNFATYNPESTTFQRIIAETRRQDVRLHTGFVSTSPELMRQVVRRGKGVALLPHALVTEDVKRGDLVTITGLEFERPIALAHRTDKEPDSRYLQLADILTTPAPQRPDKR